MLWKLNGNAGEFKVVLCYSTQRSHRELSEIPGDTLWDGNDLKPRNYAVWSDESVKYRRGHLSKF